MPPSSDPELSFALALEGVAEAFNIGLGRAVAAFSEIMGEGVGLSSPSANVMAAAAANAAVFRAPAIEVCGVVQDFETDLGVCRGVLLFPGAEGSTLLERMLAGEVPTEELDALQEDAMLELGNIVLHACVGHLADLLGGSLRSDPPRFMQLGWPTGRWDRPAIERGPEHRVLLLQADLLVSALDVQGHVLFVLDVPEMRQCFDRVLAEMVAD